MNETITTPRAITCDGGVDLMLPLTTPLAALDAFVTSCNAGECGCEDTFVARITKVEMFEEPGGLRVRISGDVTPAEVLRELAGSAPRAFNAV